MNEWLQQELSKLEELIAIQRDCIPSAGLSKDYMHGMANGMILSHAIFTNSSPEYIHVSRRPYNRIVRHKCCKSKRGR